MNSLYIIYDIKTVPINKKVRKNILLKKPITKSSNKFPSYIFDNKTHNLKIAKKRWQSLQ